MYQFMGYTVFSRILFQFIKERTTWIRRLFLYTVGYCQKTSDGNIIEPSADSGGRKA